MKAYTGAELRNYLDAAEIDQYKKRFLYSQLKKYICSENDRKVFCLYGLRRTGKTIMMDQMIRDINEYDHTMMIRCEAYDSMYELRKEIEQRAEVKYIFLDEVTKMNDFIDTASILADDYAFSGKKLVMAGTDSLGFMISKGDELLDRIHLLHTTYIPYKEYNYLLGRNLEDYIKYGGTLTDGSMFYNEDNLAEYTNSAIVNNIMHSLDCWDQGRMYNGLSEIHAAGELPTYITKVIEINNRSFLAGVVNKEFKSHDLGSLKNLMTKRNLDPTPLKSEELLNRIRKELEIIEPLTTHATDKSMKTIITYLEKLDLLYNIPETEEHIFTQPGMRYCQAEALARALVMGNEFSVYPSDVRNYLLELIDNDIRGRMLEDIIFFGITQSDCDDNYRVLKYRDDFGKEFDVVIIDKRTNNAAAIEVKHSDKKISNQYKHLTDNKFCREFEKEYGCKICSKTVIFTGTSGVCENSSIHYINAEDFLLNIDEYTEKLCNEAVIGDIIEEAFLREPHELKAMDIVK